MPNQSGVKTSNLLPKITTNLTQNESNNMELTNRKSQDVNTKSSSPNQLTITSQPTSSSSIATKRPYDVIIFAASSSVGKFLVEELALVVDKYYSSHHNDSTQSSPSSDQIIKDHHQQTSRAATISTPPLRRLSVPRHMDSIRWAVAGRSAVKLSEILCQAELSTGIKGLSNQVPIVLADLNHHKSLLDMCSKTNLVINCAGPYSTNGGEIVIKACLENNTHYIDLCHETSSFIEQTRRNYHDLAQRRGVYIINGCGFQSMSAEIGLNFVKQVVDGKIDEVKIILNLSDTKALARRTGGSGNESAGSMKRIGIISPGMWSSFLAERGIKDFSSRSNSNGSRTSKNLNNDTDSCGDGGESSNRRVLLRKDTQSLVRDVIELRNRNSFAWLQLLRGIDQAGKGYCFPMDGVTSEESQLIRGEMNNYELRKPDLQSVDGWRPIRCTSFLSMKALSDVVIFLIWMFVFNILVKFSPLRRLMKLFPAIFSFGNVSSVSSSSSGKTGGNSNLDRDSLAHIKFCQTFLVYGIPGEEAGDPMEERDRHLKRKQDLILISRVVGPEPNHVATATFAVQAALAVIVEMDHMPQGGGVITPGAAFLETNIIYQLRRRNIKFEVLKKA